MSKVEKKLIGEVIASLMLSENFGDVHENINALCRLIGEQKPQGNFVEGWKDGEILRFNPELRTDPD